MKKPPVTTALVGLGSGLHLFNLASAIDAADWREAAAWIVATLWIVGFWFMAEQRSLAWSRGALYSAQQFALWWRGESATFRQIVDELDDANPYINELKRVDR